jgi:GNAT superfamily N-acetyltransferase
MYDVSDLAFSRARVADAGILAQVSKRAFDDDVRYGAPGPGGPPGYDSRAWQTRIMRIADYYKIMHTRDIVGGIIVLRKATREYELGRIFVEPALQNKGIGTQAFEFLWQSYPLAKRWTLGTPVWNRRTRHFYAKVGFVELGEDGRGGVLFERELSARTPA